MALIGAGLIWSHSVFAQDYQITINGHRQAIDLDKETAVVLPDGTSLTVRLSQREFLSFESDMFRLMHHNAYKANRKDLGDGIFQTAVITPVGTGVLVQEYTTMDPRRLVDLMLKELTKEEVEYGYKYTEQTTQKKVGALTFRGKTAVTRYQDEEWTRSVLAWGAGNKGLLVVTFIEKERYKTEQEVIEAH